MVPPDKRRGLPLPCLMNSERGEAVPSQELLRKLIDGLGPQMFVGLMTPDGILIEANRPALAAAGLKPEDVLGKPFEEAYWWSYSEPVQQQLREAIRRAAAGESSRFDVEIRVAENQLIPIDFSLQPLADEAGKIVYLVPSANVITERKQAEVALRESQHFLQRILDSEPGTVYIYDVVERRNVWINPHWAESFGYTAEETQAMGSDLLARIFHPDDVPRIVAHHEAWRQAGEEVIREIEYRLRNKAGQWRWLISRESAFTRDETGQVTQVLGIAHDITERKRAEEALRESHRKLNSIIENLPGFVYRCRNDRDWTTEFVSQRVHGLTGYTAEEFLSGKVNMGSLIHPDDSAQVWNGVQQALQENRPFQLEYRFCNRDGAYHWVNEQGVGVYEANGALVALEGVVVDITERKRAEEALRETEEQLRLFVEHAPAAIAMFDCNMNYIAASRRWFSDYGIQDRDIIGRSHYEVFPDLPERWKEIHRRCLAGAAEKNEADPWVRKDGGTEWVRWEIRPWHKGGDEIGGLIIFSEVITERKQAEQAIRESQELLRELIDGLGPSMFVGLLTRDGMVIEANQPALEAAGLKREDVIGKPVADTYWFSYSERIQQQMQEAIRRAANGHMSRFDVTIRVAEGQFIPLDFTLQPVLDESGKVVYLVPSAMVITERKRAEEELQKYARHLQELTAYLQSVREEERTRIAREIHDDLGQLLTATRLNLTWLSGKLSAEEQRLKEKTRATVELVDSTIDTVRRIASELRPGVLDLGLAAAVEWQVNEFRSRSGIACDLSVSSEDIPLEPERATHVFRILQESLTNVARHAQATQVQVALQCTPENLVLEICDNGKGISETQPSRSRSLGLLGMRERAALVGGTLSIEPAPGGGTRVRCQVPLL